MEEHQPGSAATGSGGMGTDDTTFIKRVEPSSFGAAGDRLLVHPSSSKTSVKEPEQVERDTTSQQKEAGKLEFEAWPHSRNFRISRMNFRNEVSSCASRPIEAMAWINENESAKSVADLKKLFYITRAKLQVNFEVLDSRMASGLNEIINGDCKRRVFMQEEAAQKEKRFLTGRQVPWMISEYFKVSDTDRIRLGTQYDFEVRMEEWQRTGLSCAMGWNHNRDEEPTWRGKFWRINITVNLNSQNSQSHCCFCTFKMRFHKVNRETTLD